MPRKNVVKDLRGIALILLALHGASLLACNFRPGSSEQPAVCSSFTKHQEELWSKVITPYLAEALWLPRDSYDAGHFLMVPLHAAFFQGSAAHRNAFHKHVDRFLEHREELDSRFHPRLHYLYFLARYLDLATEHDEHHPRFDKLFSFLEEEISSWWIERPVYQSGKRFAGGVSERLGWKLTARESNLREHDYSIYQEYFVLAIALDLKAAARRLQLSSDDLFDEMLALARKALETGLQYQPDGSYLYEVGYLDDAPSYQYIGHIEKHPDLEPAPMQDVAWDTSHSHRFPLWLYSFWREAADNEDTSNEKHFEAMIHGFRQQFKSQVLVAPDNGFRGARTTNYMDGHNGLYRWQHITQGSGNGYGPYELSATLLIGWWSFLNDPGIREAYAETASAFPLTNSEISVYLGPDTTRERHPFVAGRAPFTNGFYELLSSLASALCTDELPPKRKN